MKNKLLPLSLLLLFPLTGCSINQVKAQNKANEDAGNETTNPTGENEGDVTTEEVDENIALYNRLTADDYLKIEETTLEEGTYTSKTVISLTSELGEAKTFSLSYKESIKEEDADNTPDEGGNEETTGEEVKAPRRSHHEHFGKREFTKYEGELSVGETTLSVKGHLETHNEFKEYHFFFEVSEGVKGSITYSLTESSKSFSYREGSRFNLVSEYDYELIKTDEFVSVYVGELSEEKVAVYSLTRFSYENEEYLAILSYVNEVETAKFGKIVTSEEGKVTFEEITFEEEEDEKEDGCTCDCDCCQNHHGHDKDEPKDFEDFDFDFNDGYEFHDNDFEFDDYEDLDFGGYEDGDFGEQEFGHHNNHNNHR